MKEAKIKKVFKKALSRNVSTKYVDAFDDMANLLRITKKNYITSIAKRLGVSIHKIEKEFFAIREQRIESAKREGTYR